MGNPSFKKREENRGKSPGDYWPLIALILVCVAAATALSMPVNFALMPWMHYFMGMFLCIFSLLKLFHPATFADGFQMYDLTANVFRPYAYIYPLLELALGLGYLSFWNPPVVYIATIIVMSVGAIGVIRALRRGLDINCPCMGSVLDVPLSTVTLTEDLGMLAMAVWMLWAVN